MIELTGLDHVVLRTGRREQMVAFYTDVLGARLERTIESIGLYQLRAGSALIDLFDLVGACDAVDAASEGAVNADPKGWNMDHFCLQVANFDAQRVSEHLRACGVEPGPVEQRYGAQGSGPSIYIQDPDGNTVELKGPARPGTLLTGD